jgi:hypothetical protein
MRLAATTAFCCSTPFARPRMASFEGEFSGVTESYAGKGIVRYQW